MAHTVGLLISGKLKTQQKAVHKPAATSVLLLATLSVKHKLLVLNINLILRELNLLSGCGSSKSSFFITHTHTGHSFNVSVSYRYLLLYFCLQSLLKFRLCFYVSLQWSIPRGKIILLTLTLDDHFLVWLRLQLDFSCSTGIQHKQKWVEWRIGFLLIYTQGASHGANTKVTANQKGRKGFNEEP